MIEAKTQLLELIMNGRLAKRNDASFRAWRGEPESCNVIERAVLIIGLTDPNAFIRGTCVDALLDKGTARDALRVLRLISDESWEVRSSVVLVAPQLSMHFSRNCLEKTLANDAHPIVRRDAAIGLLLGRSISSVNVLRACYQSEDNSSVRFSQANALFVLTNGEDRSIFETSVLREGGVDSEAALRQILDNFEMAPELMSDHSTDFKELLANMSYGSLSIRAKEVLTSLGEYFAPQGALSTSTSNHQPKS